MRIAFLTFETALTIIWFWAAFWMFGLLAHHNGDYGTFVGALLFLAFGVGTAAMLVHEGYLMLRQNPRFINEVMRRLPLLKAGQRAEE